MKPPSIGELRAERGNRERRRGRGWRRAVWIVAAALIAYTVAGFWVLPPIVRAQAEKRLAQTLGRPVSIDALKLNPWALSATVERFAVAERDGRPFLGWARLYVSFDAVSFFKHIWTFDAIELDQPTARVVIRRDGSFNFSDLLEKFAPTPAAATPAASAKPSAPPWPLHIRLLAVRSARVAFADESHAQPFATEAGPVDLTLTQLHTDRTHPGKYDFTLATGAGETLALRGGFYFEPFRAQGDFQLTRLDLPRYAPYDADRLRGELAAGRLSLGGHYEIDLDPAARRLRLTQGTLELSGLELDAPGAHQPVVKLASLTMTGLAADAVARVFSAEKIALTDGAVDVRREKNGALNLAALLMPRAEAPARLSRTAVAPRSAPAGALPRVSVGEIAARGLALRLTDLTLPRPATLAAADLVFDLKDFSLAPGARMPARFAFDWQPAGRVEAAGTVSLRPLAVTAAYDVKGFALGPLSPYLEQFVTLRLAQGNFSSAGSVSLALPAAGAPTAVFHGDVTLAQLDAVEGPAAESIAGCASLALKGISLALAPDAPLRLDLAEIDLTHPHAHFVVAADHALNFSGILRHAPTGSSTVAAPVSSRSAAVLPRTSPARAPAIRIGRIVIADGDFGFTDRSVQPNVQVALRQFGGEIAGLSSASLARADVDLRGKVDNLGPLAVTGRINPLSGDAFTDLAITLQHMDLLPLGPYVGKYAGRALTDGALSLDLKYRVADRRLDGRNVATLDQFTLGAPTDSPDATHLPVGLAVALLKDRAGKIVLDVPVQGSLDDPDFRISRVVWRAIGNILVKAATSPFALLGSMFGGGGEELSYNTFAPGSSALTPEDVAKLGKLARALQARPGLRLELAGGFDPAADAAALRQARLEQGIRARLWAELRRQNPATPPPDQLVVTPAQRAQMIGELFAAAFPAEIAALTPPAPPVPPPKPPSFWARVRQALGEAHTPPVKNAPPAPPPVPAPSPAEMAARLLATIPVSTDDLEQLAMARAQAVKDHLVEQGQIDAGRIFLTALANGRPLESGTRVDLHLR